MNDNTILFWSGKKVILEDYIWRKCKYHHTPQDIICEIII